MWQKISLVLLLSVWGMALYGAADQVLIKLDNQSYAAFTKERGPHLDVRVSDSSELTPAMRIYTGRFNDGFNPRSHGITVAHAKRAYIPFSQLSPSFQRQFVRKMWPKNKVSDQFYVHIVQHRYETLWSLAEWFTGSGQNYTAIRRHSGLRSNNVGLGRHLKIPLDLVIEPLRGKPNLDGLKPKDPIIAARTPLHEEQPVMDNEVVPVSTAPAPNAENELQQNAKVSGQDVEEPQPAGSVVAEEPEKKDNGTGELSEELREEIEEVIRLRAKLTYKTDAQGRYAEYRLRKGEAIYSAVVVRFCGMVRAENVNRLAGVIIARSGIRDVTDLPVGFPIRIPYESLEPAYKEVSDPEYIAYMENLDTVSKVRTDTIMDMDSLQNVFVILDAGHGGRDPGRSVGDVNEDDYVYDIVCRVKARIEGETKATVLTTVYDPNVGYKVQDVARFERDYDEVLLTRPQYKLDDSKATSDGVHLRWMFANHNFDVLRSKGIPEKNFVFASFHADSLHPSLRGSMVYVPDGYLYPRATIKRPRLHKFTEYPKTPHYFEKTEVQKAQALSWKFAANFTKQSRARNVRVHRKPIRSLIFRNPNKPFVPATLRYNKVPIRMLIEVCNLNNPHDRELIKKPAFRQQVADSFVAALYKTYGFEGDAKAYKGGSSVSTRAGR